MGKKPEREEEILEVFEEKNHCIVGRKALELVVNELIRIEDTQE
jgi:hypothetical protein